MKSKEFVKKILDTAGIEINGTRPFDIQVHDERFYDRVIPAGTLGFGESYMDGFYRMFRYYLLSCAGVFRARDLQLFQIVLSPHGVSGGYKSTR